MTGKTIATALIIGVTSAASMQYLFNNMPGTNNQLAAAGGAITAGAYLTLKTFKVV